MHQRSVPVSGGRAPSRCARNDGGMTHPSYDFTMGQPTVPQAHNLYELVSERQGQSLIITGNRAPNDWISSSPTGSSLCHC